MAILLKGKTLLVALVKLKYAWTAITAVLSVFAYAGSFGWQGAAGVVALLFVHEMGHAIVLRHYGVPTTVPLFIPFFGAVIGMKEYPKGAVEEAYSALGGPVVGSIGAYACLAMYFMTGAQIWAWLAYIGIFLNLFNLLPMSPLDGGRVIGAVWRGFWILGVVAALGLATFLDSPILMLFALWGLDDINKRFVPVHAVAYYALGLATLVASFYTHEVWFGAFICILSVVHGLLARKRSVEIESTTTTFTTGRAVEEFKTSALQVSASKPSMDWFKGLKTPIVCYRTVRKQIAASMSGVPNTTTGVDPITRLLNNQTYFSVPKSQRIIIGTIYVGLASTLGATLYWMHEAGLFQRPH